MHLDLIKVLDQDSQTFCETKPMRRVINNCERLLYIGINGMLGASDFCHHYDPVLLLHTYFFTYHSINGRVDGYPYKCVKSVAKENAIEPLELLDSASVFSACLYISPFSSVMPAFFRHAWTKLCAYHFISLKAKRLVALVLKKKLARKTAAQSCNLNLKFFSCLVKTGNGRVALDS